MKPPHHFENVCACNVKKDVMKNTSKFEFLLYDHYRVLFWLANVLITEVHTFENILQKV